jgi:hypothetical protein
MIRAVLGLVFGVIAAVLAMMAVGYIGEMLFPVSGTVDLARTDATLQTLGAASLGAKVFILLSWSAAAFAGAAVAKWISRASWPGWLIAGLLALMLAATFLVPLPTWMQILAVVGPLVGGLLADMLIKSRVAEEVDAPTTAPAAEPAVNADL